MENKNGEKGLFITWKHLGLIISVLGMAAAGYYNVRSTFEKAQILEERQGKYNKRFWELKEFTETGIWELREDYWEREVVRVKEATEMKKDIEYLKKHDHD